MVMEVLEDLMEVMVVMDTAEVMDMERERLRLSQDMVMVVMEDPMEAMVVIAEVMVMAMEREMLKLML